MLRYAWVIVAIIVVGAFVGNWAINKTVGPPQPPEVGPRLSFLGGQVPVQRVPRLEPFKACDIYSYESTVAETSKQIDHEVGDLFANRSPRFDGFAWSSAKDDSGLELVVLPERKSIETDGSVRTEPSKDWVSVYVYYRENPKESVPDFDAKLLVGRWTFDDGDEIVTKELEFRGDGTYSWTVVEPRRERTNISTGNYTTHNGRIVLKQTSYVRKTASSESAIEDLSESRYAIHWRDRDSFQMGDAKPDKEFWVRVRE